MMKKECDGCKKWKGLCKTTEAKIGCKCIECEPLRKLNYDDAFKLTNGNGKRNGWA